MIHIHEDDWGMRGLYPCSLLEELRQDMAAADAFGEAHQAPSGMGWTAMYEAQSPSKAYSNAGLELQVAAQSLGEIMPRVRRFHASISSYIGREDRDPYGTYEDDAWAFGFDARCYIKLEPDGDLVESIWFNFDSDDPRDVNAIRCSLEAIDALIPSAISDYSSGAVVRISDRDALAGYFQDRMNQIAHLREHLRADRAARAN